MMRSVAGCLLALALAQPVAAQEDSLLPQVERLIVEGQGDSARALVRGRLAALSAFDAAYPAALFAAGVVAADSTTAMNYFRRVSIEYSQSPWADDALLRLAQLNYAAGQLQQALRSAERILLDYPFSDVTAHARYWTGRIHMAVGDLTEACSQFATVLESPEADVELKNRARYHQLRCAGPGGGQDSAAQAQRPPAPGARVFAVQVAAVENAAAADELMRALDAGGYAPHVIRDTDGLLKIRVGRFATREAAQRLATELRRKLGDQISGRPFVVEET